MARHFIDLTTAKSRGDVTSLTIEAIYGQANNACYFVKSRSDSIFLTVGFNLRAKKRYLLSQVPQGRHFIKINN